MPNLAAANQYAKALLEVVSKPGSTVNPEAALAQLESFASLLRASSELKEAMLSPAVQFPAKQKVLSRLGRTLGLHPYIVNFLLVVARHRRLALMGEIQERFQTLLDESVGIVRARVASAQPLEAPQRQAIEAALARITGKAIRCGFDVDDSLLGGLAVRMGSTMYDGSVRGRLESLRRRLTTE